MLKINRDCTGCSACVNICPNNALKLGQDEDGFYKPESDKSKCSNCGLCEKICPLNGVETNNYKNPKLYVFKNNSPDSKLSATVGGFQIIAKEFIKKGGKVIGAAWDKNWRCEQIMVDNLEDLTKLYKSKYVQSYMGNNLLKRVKQELDNGIHILFSGVPCQIAGLHNFLNKEYNNLYIVDILCNNAPSSKHFERFLEERYGINNISDIDFRFKDDELSVKKMLLKISTKDGKETIDEIWKNGSYYEAFVRRMLLGYHCENCHFAMIPRLGDITLGDMHGAEFIDPKYIPLNTESAIVNSKKGEELLKTIELDTNDFTEIPLDYVVNMHHVLKFKGWSAHPNRNRLFDLLKTMPFEKACSYAIDDRYDIGLVGVITNRNYGGAVTYLALKYVLENMGKTVLSILPSENNLAWLPKAVVNFKENPYKEYEIAFCQTKHEMRNLNLKCDMFLTGSDQLYSTHFYDYGIMKDLEEFALLDWVWDSKKKAAYSASFGSNKVDCPVDMKNRMKYYLNKFDNFSVRERSAIDICKNEFDFDTEFVLDPVFLSDKKLYDNLILKSDKEIKGVVTYVLDKSPEKDNIINEIAESYSGIINHINDFSEEQGIFVEDWLKMLKTSDFIITDSFHGTCFAIIFNKPFIVFTNKTRGLDRFKLLEEFGLENRLIYSTEDFKNKRDEILSPIDWEKVNSKVNKLKERSFEILKESISKKEKPVTNEDMLSEKMYFLLDKFQNIFDTRINNEINSLRCENDILRNELNFVRYDYNNQIKALYLKLYKNTFKGKLSEFFIEKPSTMIAECRLNKLLKRLNSKKIVFWGASIFLNNFIKKYKINSDNIVAIVDSDIYKNGQKYGKYNVILPQKLEDISFDCFILTVKNNNKKIYPKIKEIVAEKYPDKSLLENIFN